MVQNWKTVRVFISSTFRDMQSERDWLVRFIFPKLRQQLLQRRIHLVDVDLRWGVTSEQDALSVCREVVDECRPRFLCMLGGRYGWVPPSKTRSITADEVHYGVLDRDLTSRGFAYFYFRDPSDTTAMVEVAPGEFREPVGSHGAVALAELKTAITGAGLQPFSYRAQWDDQSRRLIGLKEFGDRVYADLKQSIDQEFGPATGEKPDEFTEENAAMEAFIEERVQRFVLGSRQTVLNELLVHAGATGGNGYVCLTGVPGSGKSALLAHLSRHSTLNSRPSTLLICHFVGASPGSTDVRRTLRRLCHELVAGAGLTAEIPEDPEKLRVAFAEILQQASAKKHVVILLDAINQFDSTTQLAGWSWLPEELPATARVILSAVSVISDQSSVVSGRQTVISPQSSVLSPLDALRHRRNPPKEIELKPLTAEDAKAIIREFLHRYRKSMTDDQRAALLAKADAGTPLYLLVALEELRTLGTYEEITDRIAQLPPDTRALFIWILKRLEDDDGFRDASGRKIGRELVSRFVSLLGASRHGLSQQELVELLSPSDPQGNVAALAQLLRPYLMQRGELLDFYHGQFREAAMTAYLQTESQCLAAHDQLATYFRDLADPERNQSWKGNSPRPFLEVVFHLVGAQRSDDYCQTLCDLRFVEARCRYGQVFELIADYRLAKEHLPEAQAELAEERQRQERAARWTREIIEYARQWSERRDRLARGEYVTEPEPSLPDELPLMKSWPVEQLEDACRRIVEQPSSLDVVRAFAGFVEVECYALLKFGNRPSFVAQQAYNSSPDGPVHTAANRLRIAATAPLLLRRWPSTATYHPRSALLRTLDGHNGWVVSVGVTADGRRAVSGGSDKIMKTWDLETGYCLRTFDGHCSEVETVSVTPDGCCAVSGCKSILGEGSVLLAWDLEGGRCLSWLEGQGDWFRSVSVTPDGRRAASGGLDKTVRVWDLKSDACLHIFEGHSGFVECVRITPDGRRALSGSDDNTVRVWDLDNGHCLRILSGHSDAVLSVAVTTDGRRAVSASADNTIRVWDLESGTCLRVLYGHTQQVGNVSVTPDGLRAISLANDRSLRVWDLELGTCLHTLKHRNLWGCLSVTPDGRRAISGSQDGSGSLRVWDLEHGVSLDTSLGHSDGVTSVSVTPDGRRAVTGSRDHTLRVWDLASGACLHTLLGHTDVIQAVSLTADGQYVVSGSWEHTLRVWDLESGTCLRTMEGHSNNVMSVRAVPNGRWVVSGGLDETVRVWDLASGQCLRTLTGNSSVRSVSVTPDGRRAVSGSECWAESPLLVWDLETGRCLRVLEGHNDSVTSVSVTPDGRRAVSGSCDKTVRVWDLETGHCLRVLEGNNSHVWSVSVTPEGQRAVSAGSDKTLRVWDLNRGACLAVYAAPSAIMSLDLPCNGCSICIATGSGEVMFLNIEHIKDDPYLNSCVLPDLNGASYEQVLRRGLELSRRSKGDDHDETLAHLIALAVHLENEGKAAEAAEYRHEHARITVQIAERKKQQL